MSSLNHTWALYHSIARYVDLRSDDVLVVHTRSFTIF